MDADEASEGTDPARTAARGNAAKRQRSILGQPALKVPSAMLHILCLKPLATLTPAINQGHLSDSLYSRL